VTEKSFIVKFNGGLGNQLFEYAFAKGLEAKTGIKTIFDMSFFKKRYAVERPYQLALFNANVESVNDFWTSFRLELIWRLRKRLNNKTFLGISFYKEACFELDEQLFNLTPSTYIEGFFQSEKYFKHIEGQIRADLQFKDKLEGLSLEISKKIAATNSVSLHIRRGDYVQKKRNQSLYAACSLDYYKRGLEQIVQKIDNPTLFIFSDDIEWVKENLKLPYESVYVTHNTGAKSYEDLRLMSLCKHNIIANSSFSWWGAWLNNNQEKIVIAPLKWFNDDSINQSDVIPCSWVRIDN